ncbi:MAG: hypothetical protein ABF318_19700, partial [Ketobacter sp.]
MDDIPSNIAALLTNFCFFARLKQGVNRPRTKKSPAETRRGFFKAADLLGFFHHVINNRLDVIFRAGRAG